MVSTNQRMEACTGRTRLKLQAGGVAPSCFAIHIIVEALAVYSGSPDVTVAPVDLDQPGPGGPGFGSRLRRVLIRVLRSSLPARWLARRAVTDIVHDPNSARRVRHTGRRAFVLGDRRRARPVGDPAVHGDLEAVGPDHSPSQPGPDLGFEQPVLPNSKRTRGFRRRIAARIGWGDPILGRQTRGGQRAGQREPDEADRENPV